MRVAETEDASEYASLHEWCCSAVDGERGLSHRTGTLEDGSAFEIVVFDLSQLGSARPLECNASGLYGVMRKMRV